MKECIKCESRVTRTWKMMCSSCYQKTRRKPKRKRELGTCPHDDRPRYCRGQCESCYKSDQRHPDFNRKVAHIEDIVEDMEVFGLGWKEILRAYDTEDDLLRGRLKNYGRVDLIPGREGRR